MTVTEAGDWGMGRRRKETPLAYRPRQRPHKPQLSLERSRQQLKDPTTSVACPGPHLAPMLLQASVSHSAEACLARFRKLGSFSLPPVWPAVCHSHLHPSLEPCGLGYPLSSSFQILSCLQPYILHLPLTLTQDCPLPCLPTKSSCSCGE